MSNEEKYKASDGLLEFAKIVAEIFAEIHVTIAKFDNDKFAVASIRRNDSNVCIYQSIRKETILCRHDFYLLGKELSRQKNISPKTVHLKNGCIVYVGFTCMKHIQGDALNHDELEMFFYGLRGC